LHAAAVSPQIYREFYFNMATVAYQSEGTLKSELIRSVGSQPHAVEGFIADLNATQNMLVYHL